MKYKTFRLCILLSLLLALLTPQPALAVSGVWKPTGSMVAARENPSATLLPNGKVLVAGGWSGTIVLASAELYDPTIRTWTLTGSMVTARFNSTATLLPNGKVLVTGGHNGTVKLTSAELYDPTLGTWTQTGSMSVVRENHTATLLLNGKVLVTGDLGTTSAEIYDPATGTWTPTGSMAAARADYTATLLPNGKVLVAGGFGAGFLSSAELYNPATGTWASTGSLAQAHQGHTATLLPNGKVLIAGGLNNSGELSSAEIYDPATGTWAPTGSLSAARRDHVAALLPNGKVLTAAGFANNTYLASAELYNPATGTWASTSSMVVARFGPTAILLPNGKVLAAGGSTTGGAIVASAELFTSTALPAFKSAGIQDGWVLETNETSNQGGTVNAAAVTFVLGDDAARRQYRSVLSFNTASLPDNAVITGLILKIRRQGIAGVNPFTTHGKVVVDIRKGPFSNANPLQPTDFQAAANKPGVGAFVNNPQAGGWYVTRLGPAAFPFIHRAGLTQLRLRFQKDDDNDAVADSLRFYSGNAPAASRPVLLIEYYVP